MIFAVSASPTSAVPEIVNDDIDGVSLIIVVLALSAVKAFSVFVAVIAERTYFPVSDDVKIYVVLVAPEILLQLEIPSSETCHW